MARKKQNSLFDQAKSFRDSDTAKAIGTVLAVLLIPASVIAWNYLSTAKTEDNINGGGASTEVEEKAETEMAEEEKMPTETEEESAGGIGGIGGVTTLPDTNSRE